MCYESGNGKVGIALRTHAPADQSGPVAAIQVNSGQWVAGSRLVSDQRIALWDTELIAEGPVFVEARVKIRFTDLGVWESRYRIYRDEPVILIDEQFTLRKRATFQLQLDTGLQPDTLLYRSGQGNVRHQSYGSDQSGSRPPVRTLAALVGS